MKKLLLSIVISFTTLFASITANAEEGDYTRIKNDLISYISSYQTSVNIGILTDTERLLFITNVNGMLIDLHNLSVEDSRYLRDYKKTYAKVSTYLISQMPHVTEGRGL